MKSDWFFDTRNVDRRELAAAKVMSTRTIPVRRVVLDGGCILITPMQLAARG